VFVGDSAGHPSRGYGPIRRDPAWFGQRSWVAAQTQDRRQQRQAERDQARIGRGTRNTIEHRARPDFRQRAANIDAAAGAVSSDDPDAIAKLRERIAALETERDTLPRLSLPYAIALVVAEMIDAGAVWTFDRRWRDAHQRVAVPQS
jgi:hypothetical protein